jgi:hypothetical protein
MMLANFSEVLRVRLQLRGLALQMQFAQLQKLT